MDSQTTLNESVTSTHLIKQVPDEMELMDFDFQGHLVKYVTMGCGEPIVFIHNGGTSHVIWTGLLKLLSKTYTVYAVDLPGFGDSPMPSEGYNLSKYVDLMEAFIHDKCNGPVRLVGNCMGSAISLRLSQRDSTKVHSMVLFNPLTEGTFYGGWMGSTLWIRKNSKSFSDWVCRVIESIPLPKWTIKACLAFQLGKQGRSSDLHSDKKLTACYVRKEQMSSLFSIYKDLENYASLDTFEPSESDFPPICTIWGLENKVLSAKAGRKLNVTLQPKREEYIQACGHLVMLEAPEQVKSVLIEFFAEY